MGTGWGPDSSVRAAQECKNTLILIHTHKGSVFQGLHSQVVGGHTSHLTLEREKLGCTVNSVRLTIRTLLPEQNLIIWQTVQEVPKKKAEVSFTESFMDLQ